MSNPEQNPSGTPNPYGTPQDPAAGQAPQAPQAPQYGAPQAPAPQGYGSTAPATDPGKTLGVVGLVLSIIGCTSLIGLILSIVALSKSKKAGFKNGIALAGIIVGAVMLVGIIIFGILAGAGIFTLLEKCAELGPGSHYVDGVQINCG